MTFLTFQVTSFSGLGTVEVATGEGTQVFEQGKLWEGIPRRPRPHLVRNIDGYALELHEGTGPYKPPQLRVIKGGKA